MSEPIDWNQHEGRFRNTRKGNLFVHQRFALDRYTGYPSVPGPSPPKKPLLRELACPICGLTWPFNDFQEDHCPQRAGQSSLAGRFCVVLTCKDCNPLAGSTYEAEANEISRGDKDARTDTIYASQRASGLWAVSGIKDNAEVLTDLKSAFLIAFAVLGYRFAFAPNLRSIRAAILAGQPPPIGGADNRTDGFPKYSVTEVFGHEDGVGLVVVAGEDQMWKLPVGARPFQDPTISNRKSTRDWPPIEQSGNRNAMQKFLEDGCLFHADHCRVRDRRVLHGPKQHRSRWPVTASEAEPAQDL